MIITNGKTIKFVQEKGRAKVKKKTINEVRLREKKKKKNYPKTCTTSN